MFRVRIKIIIFNDLLACVLQEAEIVHYSEELRLALFALARHVVQQVHAGPVGPDVAQLVQGGDLHPCRVARIPSL